jgi:WD40 repeat protein
MAFMTADPFRAVGMDEHTLAGAGLPRLLRLQSAVIPKRSPIMHRVLACAASFLISTAPIACNRPAPPASEDKKQPAQDKAQPTQAVPVNPPVSEPEAPANALPLPPPPTKFEEIASLPNPIYGTEMMAFTPDGRALLVSGEDRGKGPAAVIDAVPGSDFGKVKYWLPSIIGPTFDAGQLVRNPLVISPDGKTIAAVAKSMRSGVGFILVDLYHTATGTKRASLKGLSGEVDRIVFDPTGRWIAASGESDFTTRRGHELVVWEVATGNVRLLLTSVKKSILDIAFGPSGNTLVFAAGDDNGGEVRFLSLDNLESVSRPKVLFQKNEPQPVWFARVSADETSCIWRTPDGFRKWHPNSQVTESPAAGYLPHLSPDGKLLLSYNDRGLILWDATTFASAGTIKLSGGRRQMLFSPNSRRIATIQGPTLAVADVDAKAVVWSSTSPSGYWQLPMVFNPRTGDLAVLSPRDREILLFSIPGARNELQKP